MLWRLWLTILTNFHFHFRRIEHRSTDPKFQEQKRNFLPNTSELHFYSSFQGYPTCHYWSHIGQIWSKWPSWSKKYDCRLGTALIDFLIKYDRTKQTPRKLPYFQKFDTKLISLPIFDRRQIPFISSVLIVCLWSKTNLCLNFILKYKLPKLRRCASQVVSIPHTCHIFYTNKILHWENA